MAYVRASFIIGTASTIGTSANVVITDSTGISWTTIPDGSTLHYAIQNKPTDGNEEAGLGTKTTIAGKPVLQRSAVNVETGSSGPGVLVNFTAATQQIYIAPLAEVEVLPNVTADPLVLSTGQLWFRSDLPAFKGSLDGATAVTFFTGTAVSSFNSRTGAVTLTSADVTTALGDTNVAYLDTVQTWTAVQTFRGATTSDTPIIVKVKGTAGGTQVANFQEWRDSANLLTICINPSGHFGAGDNGHLRFDSDYIDIYNSAGTFRTFLGQSGNFWTDNLLTSYLLLGDYPGGNGGALHNSTRLGLNSVYVQIFGNADLTQALAPTVPFEVTNLIAATNVVTAAVATKYRTSGTAASGFGAGFQVFLDSSTTHDRQATEDDILWATATDATRKARCIHYIYDTAAREVEREEASGSAAMKSWFGVTAVVQQNTTGTTQQTSAGTGAAVKTDSTTTGGTGAAAYTVADVVLALKNYGLLAS